MADLLLHSLAEFEELIAQVLDAVAVRTTAEIGVEYGPLSRALIARARRVGGRHVGIDPAPRDGARDLFAVAEAELFTQPSREALAAMTAVDAYFLDGDHNYATVGAELVLIEQAARKARRRFPLVFLHDIGWPWGRRDLYYDPASLPEGAVHPYTFAGGVTPDNADTIAGGFRGEGKFAYARREGGPRNGVRTAIDDFLAGRDLAFFEIPPVFGLGILCGREGEPILAPLLAPFHANPLLARLERNRIDLYLRVLALQDELNAHRILLRQAVLRRRADSEKTPA
jgi:hypothetical protein